MARTMQSSFSTGELSPQIWQWKESQIFIQFSLEIRSLLPVEWISPPITKTRKTWILNIITTMSIMGSQVSFWLMNWLSVGWDWEECLPVNESYVCGSSTLPHSSSATLFWGLSTFTFRLLLWLFVMIPQRLGAVLFWCFAMLDNLWWGCNITALFGFPTSTLKCFHTFYCEDAIDYGLQ